jgi:hypothetical protein
MTAGLDLGDKYSYLCLIDTESGEVVKEGRLRTTPEALRRRFGAAFAHRRGDEDPLALGQPALGGVRPRGAGRQCSQIAVPLRQQAQYRRDRRLKNLARLARPDTRVVPLVTSLYTPPVLAASSLARCHAEDGRCCEGPRGRQDLMRSRRSGLLGAIGRRP